MEAGDNDEAEQTIRKAVAEWEKLATECPNNTDYRGMLGETYGVLSNILVTARRLQEAEQICMKAIEKWPDSATLFVARGRTYMALQQPDKALPDLSKAIELAPNDGATPWWYGERAACHAALKQEEKALADLSKAIELRPKIFDTWVWRGNFYRDRQQWDNAVADYSNVVELNSTYWPAWQSRGIAYANLKQWNKAILDYGKAVEVNPKSADLHSDLAWLLVTCPDATLRQPARAVELAKKAVELAPQTGHLWIALGVAHYRAADWKAAIEALNKSVELHGGGDGFELFFLAMAHWQLGQKEDARKWFNEAVAWMDKNQPQNEELHRFRSEAAGLLSVKEKND